MNKSQRVRLTDLRVIHRTAGECSELWFDPQAWRERWYDGACRLVGAIGAMGGEAEGFFSDPRQRILQFLYHGFDGPTQRRHQEYLAEGGHRTIDQPLRAFPNDAPELVTRSHEQLIELPQWRRSELFNDYFRPLGLDDRLLSVARFDRQEKGALPLYNVITVYRGVGERLFSARERKLVHLLHEELRPMIGTRLATCLQRNTRGLSPRLRQVLQCLLDGHSEKQIALGLQLSRPTVNQYVGSIYRHFGVHTRRELMAYFVRRRPTQG